MSSSGEKIFVSDWETETATCKSTVVLSTPIKMAAGEDLEVNYVTRKTTYLGVWSGFQNYKSLQPMGRGTVLI